jgi:mono/diheme cytochrome c family protein
MRKKAILLLPFLAITFLGARHRAVSPPDAPTFDREVVRILQQNCQSCHHPDDIAPFSLMTYGDAVLHADAIKYMTQTRQMPPWKAAAGCGDFVGTRAMVQSDIDTIARWVDGGMREGNAADLPALRTFDGGWPAGKPDVILSMPKAFTPPAAVDEYRCFSVPGDAAKEMQVTMVDFRPGDRGTVHHIVPYLDITGASAKLDANGDGYQCFGGPGLDAATPLGAWTPGARPVPLPEGTAVRIPKGARVVMQVHYHPHFGRVAPDQTQIGLYLTTAPVRKQLHYKFILNDQFVIRAGDHDSKVDAFEATDTDIDIVSVYPHMHLLGTKTNVEARLPDGTTVCMIDVPQYDFNWQGQYVYTTPLHIGAGGVIHIESHFDNSTDNWHNPSSPPKDVRWGEQTTDEMCLALIGYTTADGK